MTYDEAIQKIHGLLRFGSKPGLSRTKKLLEKLGNPQKGLKIIHVAGTNGKGSTCAMLSEIMQAAGYKAGLFISPYVLEFCERIQVDGKMISRQDVADYTEQIMKVQDETDEDPATEFEFITALAFQYFADSACDVVVLETGLGGRFDATNVIDTPLCSVITSISLDHMEYLGDTVSKIASQKCGIIKPDGCTVCYPKQSDEALCVIRKCVEKQRNRWICPDLSELQILQERMDGSIIRYRGNELRIPLIGSHQVYNAITAYHAAVAVRDHGFLITDKQIANGIAGVRFPARFEVISKTPLVILDGGHNADGAFMLYETLRRHLKDWPLVAIMGVLADKDYETTARLIAPLCKTAITVKPDLPRGLGAEEFGKAVRRYCDDVIVAKSKKEALEIAGMKMEGDPLLVCGSLYLAGEIRSDLLTFAKNF